MTAVIASKVNSEPSSLRDSMDRLVMGSPSPFVPVQPTQETVMGWECDELTVMGLCWVEQFVGKCTGELLGFTSWTCLGSSSGVLLSNTQPVATARGYLFEKPGIIISDRAATRNAFCGWRGWWSSMLFLGRISQTFPNKHPKPFHSFFYFPRCSEMFQDVPACYMFRHSHCTVCWVLNHEFQAAHCEAEVVKFNIKRIPEEQVLQILKVSFG